MVSSQETNPGRFERFGLALLNAVPFLYVVGVSSPDQPKVAAMASRLLGWFRASARDLPWRHTRDPYAIWVSEIMLQQTQVATVIPYFDRWMRQLPTIESLARARLPKVLKLWAGLGYYRRARNLHAAARQIVACHGGHFPREFDTILELPGIGRYTAGAIASIAFNDSKPVVDGNVIRVLSRVEGIIAPVATAKVQRSIWDLAEELVRAASTLPDPGQRNCGDLNQSLMELGATVCTPREPVCGSCPIATHCAARTRGLTAEIPVIAKRPKSKLVCRTALVLESRGRLLLVKRNEAAVNGGLWEFPNAARVTELAPLFATLDVATLPPKQSWKRVGAVRHTIMNQRFVIEVWSAVSSSNHALRNAKRGKWVTLAGLSKLPFGGADAKILKALSTRNRAKKE